MISRKNIILTTIILYNIIVTAQEINITSIRGARNGSMGDALISESNDVSIMYLNPASLMFLKEKTLFFNLGHFQKNLGMRENFAAPVLQFTKFTLSVGLESYQMGYLKENFNFPGKQIFEYGYNISAASNIIEETFGVGAAFGFRSGSVGSSNNWAATYTLGINYSPSSDINYGLVLSGLGDNLEYMNEDTILTVKRESSNKRLVLGASMKFPSSSSLRRTVFVLALANEKIFGENGLLYKVGFEVSPWPVVNLRFGYVFGPQVSEPRFGAGLNLNLFMFDYVFYAGPSPVMMQQFSLSIKI